MIPLSRRCLILLLLLSTLPAAAQTTFIPTDYFPAPFEFPALGEITEDLKVEEPTAIQNLENGPLLAEAGAQRCEIRSYALPGGADLTIRIVTFEDARGAYSLLSLTGGAPIRNGPPGDFFVSGNVSYSLAQGRFWVEIRGEAAGDLVSRVARSISNRIDEHAESRPALLKHFPADGLDTASIRYGLGPIAVREYLQPIAGRYLDFPALVETAQAFYAADAASGILTLISFPTMQLAEDYYEMQLPVLIDGSSPAQQLFARRAGTIIAILEGTFGPLRADMLLGSLEYEYTITWIYDINRQRAQSFWDMPFGIMDTVVRSIVLVSLLCVLSIIAGVVLAILRIGLRTYAPHNILDRPERTELIRLKINED